MLIESETRKVIDEQLRKVGWEADTDALRHSKGTRPQNARNIAVAEWPTDNGFADYVLFVGMKLVAVIEAKANYKDVSAVIDCQGKDYARNIRDAEKNYQLDDWRGFKVPFVFATNINAYLLDAPNIFVESRPTHLQDFVPAIGIGNKPIDDGNFLFTLDEMERLHYPRA